MCNVWAWAFARSQIRSQRKWGEAYNPRWTAACGTSLIILLNVWSLVLVAGVVLDLDPTMGLSKLGLAALYLVLVYLVHRHYVVGGAANELIKKLKAQSKAEARRDERKYWLYIIGSLHLPVIIMVAALYFQRK
jgi:hypothetical protein